MDLLKEITSELRGGDESANDDDRTNSDESANDERTDRDGYSDSTADSATDTESVVRSTTATDDSGAGDDPESTGETPAGTEGNTDASEQRDEHLCSFCETEFDADRTVCPECDAEIVVRGAR